MTDGQLLDLFWDRREEALDGVREKYGPWCGTIARNILGDERDVGECLNDCWLALWNAIPPARPERFQGYVGAVVRNRALQIRSRRGRQGDTVSLAALELAQCLPAQDGPEEQMEAAELGQAISRFLEGEKVQVRAAFLRRYWYADRVEEVAGRLGWSVSKTKTVLFRTRKKLRTYLEREGYL